MRQSDMEAGRLAAFYTLNSWFCTIRPAFAIGRVRCDFVKKGTNAKESFSVYVEMDDFDLLCDDILAPAERFKKAIDAVRDEKYGTVWKIVNGENGSRQISIGPGTKAFAVISGRDKEKNMQGMVPVSYDDLRKLAKTFHRVSEAAYKERAAKCVATAESFGKKDEARVNERAEADAPEPWRNADADDIPF